MDNKLSKKYLLILAPLKLGFYLTFISINFIILTRTDNNIVSAISLVNIFIFFSVVSMEIIKIAFYDNEIKNIEEKVHE